MPIFIELTDLSGSKIYVNVAHIFCVYGDINTYIWHGVENGSTCTKETREEVMNLIKEATNG